MGGGYEDPERTDRLPVSLSRKTFCNLSKRPRSAPGTRSPAVERHRQPPSRTPPCHGLCAGRADDGKSLPSARVAVGTRWPVPLPRTPKRWGDQRYPLGPSATASNPRPPARPCPGLRTPRKERPVCPLWSAVRRGPSRCGHPLARPLSPALRKLGGLHRAPPGPSSTAQIPARLAGAVRHRSPVLELAGRRPTVALRRLGGLHRAPPGPSATAQIPARLAGAVRHRSPVLELAGRRPTVALRRLGGLHRAPPGPSSTAQIPVRLARSVRHRSPVLELAGRRPTVAGGGLEFLLFFMTRLTFSLFRARLEDHLPPI